MCDRQIKEPGNSEKLGLYFSKSARTLKAALWAPLAEKVNLLIFSSPDTTQKPLFCIKMKQNKKTGVWHVLFNTEAFDQFFKNSESIDGAFYCYAVTNRNQKEQFCLDPYSFSMAAYCNDQKFCPGAIVDLCSNKNAENSTVSKTRLKRCRKSSIIIYETSVRDFTIGNDAHTKNRGGSYKAFAEKLLYIKELGVTHIELMPVLNFYNNDETNALFSNTKENSNYNWGYDPHNYFSPEGWFSSNPENPYSRINELRELIEEAHKTGLRIILDVVYNHMASTDFLNQIVPDYFFRKNEDGSFTSASGCGNDCATEKKAMQKLIVDSLEHWTKNYDVDGFRFDLMGLIDTETIFEGLKKCRKYKSDILFIGEGWKMYNGKKGRGMDQNMMSQTKDISVFNDEFRDLIKAGGMNETRKAFITDDAESKNYIKQLFFDITGRPQVNYTVSTPLNNVQYLEAHDGLTLHDNILYNCALDENNEQQRNELYKRLKLGNFIVLTSQGIPFLHAGQEYGRSKPALYESCENTGAFVRNSYNAPDLINAFKWNRTKEQNELCEYTKSLLKFRNSTGIFKLGSLAEIEKSVQFQEQLSKNQLLVYCINQKNSCWFVAVNVSKEKQSLALAIKRPQVYADINGASVHKIEKPEGIVFQDNSVELAPLSAFIFK